MVLLGKRITDLLRRSGQAPTPQTITFGDVTVDFSGYTASDGNGKIDIMPKEIDLLRLLVEHKGLVLTRSQIRGNCGALITQLLTGPWTPILKIFGKNCGICMSFYHDKLIKAYGCFLVLFCLLIIGVGLTFQV